MMSDDRYGMTIDGYEAFKKPCLKAKFAKLKEDLLAELARLKTEEPDKYQELIDAEQSMYKSWLQHEGRI